MAPSPDHSAVPTAARNTENARPAARLRGAFARAAALFSIGSLVGSALVVGGIASAPSAQAVSEAGPTKPIAAGARMAAVQPATEPTPTPSTVAAAPVYKLPMPSKSFRLTSPKGPRCMPAVGATTEHLGQDMGASNATAIYSIADGTVVKARKGTSSLSGYVVVESTFGGKKYQIAYIHMWDGLKYVKVGSTVKAGQRIADVGASGPATGPHLHLEVWTGAFMASTALDPVAFLKPYGVDLEAHAQYVNKPKPPATCTYYALRDSVVYSSASTTSTVVKSFEKGTVATSWPGAMSNAMLKVSVGGTTGYAPWNSMSPNYVAPDPAVVIRADAASKGKKFTTTSNLNLRVSARDGAIKAVLPQGTVVTGTGRAALSTPWYEVTTASGTGWVSSLYLEPVSVGTTPPTSTTPPSPTPEQTPPTGTPTQPGPSTSTPGKPSTTVPTVKPVNPVKPAAPKPPTLRTQIVVAGKKGARSAKVGATLRQSTTVGGTSAGYQRGYQWLRDGKAIKGATKSTYKATVTDFGRKLSLKVSLSKKGQKTVTATSATAKITAASSKAGSVKIGGKAKAGFTLKARTSSWAKGSTLTYRWYVGGKLVAKGKKSSYKLPRSARGKKVSVKVTALKRGYATVSRTSSKVTVAKR